MPDRPERDGGPPFSEDDLAAEVAEFEAELKRAIGEQPLSTPSESLTPELPQDLPHPNEIEGRFDQILDRMGLASTVPEPEPETGAASELPSVAGRFDAVDDEFEARLRQLDRKSETSSKNRVEARLEAVRKQRQEQESARGLGIGLTVAYTIIGLPLLGAGIGYLIDRSMGGSGGIAAGTAIGVVAGMAAAIFMLNRWNDR